MVAKCIEGCGITTQEKIAVDGVDGLKPHAFRVSCTDLLFFQAD